jgi:hypothetical protein
LWNDYLQRLQAAGFAGETGRDIAMAVASSGPACGKH